MAGEGVDSKWPQRDSDARRALFESPFKEFASPEARAAWVRGLRCGTAARGARAVSRSQRLARPRSPALSKLLDALFTALDTQNAGAPTVEDLLFFRHTLAVAGFARRA
jgi:hypothetical protein